VIQKIVKKISLNDADLIKSDLEYWLSRTPEERLSAVEILRRQKYGDDLRVDKTICIIHKNHHPG
jgi:hypothetical protein